MDWTPRIACQEAATTPCGLGQEDTGSMSPTFRLVSGVRVGTLPALMAEAPSTVCGQQDQSSVFRARRRQRNQVSGLCLSESAGEEAGPGPHPTSEAKAPTPALSLVVGDEDSKTQAPRGAGRPTLASQVLLGDKRGAQGHNQESTGPGAPGGSIRTAPLAMCWATGHAGAKARATLCTLAVPLLRA